MKLPPDRRCWTRQSRMAAVSHEATPANVTGRARVVDGVLTPTANTAILTAADFPVQDFIVDPAFLTAGECERLAQAFDALIGHTKSRKIGIAFWEGRIVYMGDVQRYSPELATVMGDFQKRATARLTDFYALTAPLWTDTVQLNIWGPGSSLPPHTDNSNPDGTPHSTPWRDFSSVVYLNDDYEGGELYFTAQDRMLRPRKGMLVAFSAGCHHEHGVLKVTAGRRLTMPAFYTFDAAHADKIIYPELYAPKPAPLAILQPTGPRWTPPGRF